MSELEGIESVGGSEKTGMKGKEQFNLDDYTSPDQSQFATMSKEGAGGESQFQKVDGKWVEAGPEQSAPVSESQQVGAATKSEASEMRAGRSSAPDRVEGTSGVEGSIADNIGELKSQVRGINDLKPSDIQAQSKELAGKLESLRNQLESSKGDLKPSYHKVLENRLSHIDDSLKVALSKVGGEYNAAPAAKGTTPVHKFIGMLTDGQHQLQNLDSTIAKLQLAGGEITPANMLALQVKMGQIQQQVELFSNLLNKALESTKSIMNVQV